MGINRADKSGGLSREKEARKQWRQALAAMGLTSTWGVVRARFEHDDNTYLRRPPEQ